MGLTGKLEGQVAIVTGATSGIGEAIANRFAAEGARVVLAGRREDRGRRNAQKIVDSGGEAVFVPTDVTSRAEVAHLVRVVFETYGRVDILVNNAGMMMNKTFAESSPADWFDIMSVDGLGCLHCMWEVLPIMKEQGSGCVINVTSKAGSRPSDKTPFYCFVKAGMDHLTRCLNNDYAEFGIRLNCIAPGLVLSEMTDGDPRFYQLVEGVPMKRYATPDEIAGSAVFLASADASYISGAVLNVDGGVVS